jgi:glycosyltransferase involved in cell wall biosynthesis
VSQPLVSIITPSFNQAAYIQATIDSVLMQNYPTLEYLIIDGGSTDGTVEILRNCHDPRLKWVSEPDCGQSDAINKGLKWATGEVIAYINSDDLLLPGAVSVTMDAFQRYPDAALVYGDCIHIDGQGAQIGGEHFGEAFDLEQVLMGRVFIPQQTVFWRRQVTERIGLFDESLHYLMDVDYWLRSAAAGFELMYVPGIRAGYRLHDDSKTVSRIEYFWRDWDTMIAKFFALANLPPEMARLRAATRKTYWWMYTLRGAWLQGARAELRPLLRRIMLGPVPFSHRLLANLMLLDTYLGTSLSDRAVELLQRTRAR